jgi:hypothetical protein
MKTLWKPNNLKSYIFIYFTDLCRSRFMLLLSSNSYEHGDELLVFIKSTEFLHWMSDY